jgi:hypothetical protein
VTRKDSSGRSPFHSDDEDTRPEIDPIVAAIDADERLSPQAKRRLKSMPNAELESKANRVTDAGGAASLQLELPREVRVLLID